MDINYFYTGGKIKANTLHGMIKNGYSKKPQTTDNIDGYQLDKSLSGTRAQVYYHPHKDHVLVSHRGTSGLKDVYTDMKLMMGFKKNARFAHGAKITKQALNKYHGSDVTLAGHSLGSAIANQSNKDGKHEVISVNGAIVPSDIFNKKNKNETVVKSKYDPISALHHLKAHKSKSINVDVHSYNPLTNHDSNVLSKLGDQEIGI